MVFSHLMTAGITPGDSASRYFDAQNMYTHRSGNLSGVSDSSLAIVSFWLNITSLHAGTHREQHYVLQATTYGGIQVSVTNSHEVLIQGYKRSAFPYSNQRIVTLQSNVNAVSPGSYYHVLGAWDTRSNLAANRHLYLNDVSNIVSISNGQISPVDYTNPTEWYVSQPNSFFIHGCLSELYVNTDEYLDLSITSNRRKFIDAAGYPADLGDDGSLPTGNKPAIYAPDGNPVTNKGYGGNFTLVGSVGVCSEAPA